MTQGTLHPGILPKLLGELHLGRKSGFLRLAKGEQTVDLDLNEGGILRVCGIRGRDSLIEAFSWDGGKYVFLEGPAASPDDEQALDLGLPLVLRDGFGNGAADAVTHVLGDLDDVVALESEERRDLVCTPMDHIILQRVDGTRSVRRIIEQVPLPAEETQRSLAVLLCAGVLQARTAHPPVEAAMEPNDRAEATASPAVPFEEALETTEGALEAGAPEEDPARAVALEKTSEAQEAASAPEVFVAPVSAPAPVSALEVEGEAALDTTAPENALAPLAVVFEETIEAARAAVEPGVTETAQEPLAVAAEEAAEAAAEPTAPEEAAPPRPVVLEAQESLETPKTAEVMSALEEPAAQASPTAESLDVGGEAAVEPAAPETAPALLATALQEVIAEAVKAVEAAEAEVEPNRPEPRATPVLPTMTREGPGHETAASPRRDSGDLQERLDDRVLLDVLGIGKGEMPVDLMDNALVADDVIRKATSMMAGSDPFGAIRLLEAVIPRIYVKELKREAQVLLARGYTRNPKWVRRGEEMLQNVLREDPSFVEAYLALGTLYKENGLRARAITMFRKVLELKPDHNLAAAEVRLLSAPPPSKKLFGRT